MPLEPPELLTPPELLEVSVPLDEAPPLLDDAVTSPEELVAPELDPELPSSSAALSPHAAAIAVSNAIAHPTPRVRIRTR